MGCSEAMVFSTGDPWLMSASISKDEDVQVISLSLGTESLKIYHQFHPGHN